MLTILIPAAGTGTRFSEAGYARPKALVDVVGKPMLQRVVENLRPITAHRVVLVSRLDPLSLHPLLEKHDIAVHLSQPTEGAIDTILRAKAYIGDEPLLLANCDQLVNFDVNDFIASANQADGAIVTFKSQRDHHSYVQTDSVGLVYEIAEKRVISAQAVAGVYFFQNGTDFLWGAEQVLEHNDRYNNEYYVSSALRYMIKDGHKLVSYNAPSFMLGTPEELQLFEVAVHLGRNVL